MWKKWHLHTRQCAICTALLATFIAHPVNSKQGTLPEGKGLFVSSNQLMEAKLDALRKKELEQDKLLAEANLKLMKEQGFENKIFDTHAYLSLSISNSAPPLEYELQWTDIYVDNKLFARGGKRNNGLPRNSQMFFGPVPEGCHDIVVKASFVRLKNNLYDLFRVSRHVLVERRQTFIAKAGHRIDIAIEGLEVPNQFVDFYRGPSFRFIKTVRPNFLSKAPPLSFARMASKGGRVLVDYVTGDETHSRLVSKSISIDGLPVMLEGHHDPAKNKSILFDKPLAEGRHTMKVTLVLGQKTWIGGGPLFNFRLTFDRDFYVMAGQTSIINLIGMPKNGFRSSEEDSRYARVSSRITATEDESSFPEMSCKELKAKEIEQEKEKEAQKIGKSTKMPKTIRNLRSGGEA